MHFGLCSDPNTEYGVCADGEPYQSSIPPRPWPVVIRPTVEILDILNVNEEEQKVTLFVNFITEWEDSGIGFTPGNGTR